MEHEGPALETLLRRVTETPPDFLAEPRIGGRGDIVVAAVVRDLLEHWALPIAGFDAGAYTGRDAKTDRNWSAITLVSCWLLAESELRACTRRPERLPELLKTLPRELSVHTNASALISDADRREELVRLSLAALALRPAGESQAEAQDRLSTMSSVERARLLAASRAAEQRAREVREALARKAAEESADKWSRE